MSYFSSYSSYLNTRQCCKDPVGPQGATGPQGETGATGATGPQGATGSFPQTPNLQQVLDAGSTGTSGQTITLDSSGNTITYGGNTITSNTSINLNSGPGSVIITQPTNQATKLTTDNAFAQFYPDYVVDNNNQSSVVISNPQVIHQRLTLNNLGLSSVNVWSDYGVNSFVGFSAVATDSNGYVWLADSQGSGQIYVFDNTMTNIQYTISTSNGSGYVTINVLFYASGYMYIGGNFTSINTIPQYGITRVSIVSYTEDPVFDGGTIIGIQMGQEVYCIEDVSGELVIGGNFSSWSNGTPCSQIGIITNPYSFSGSQIFNEFQGGVNAKVWSIYYDTITNFTYVGGDFTNVDVSGLGPPYAYCAYYDNNLSSWNPVAGNNFNGSVYLIKKTSYAQIWVGGSFGPVSGVGQQYNTYVDVSSPQINWFDTGLVLVSPPTYKQGFYTSPFLAVINGANFYISNAYGIWTSLGAYGGTGTITGINYWNSNWKVILDSYNYVRSYGHSCIFTGSFKYDNVFYSNYTISTRNVSQQFIGDTTCSFWSIIGQGVGAFS
jgi:hypothetical protein